MDRFRLKAKKEKPIKHHDKAKPHAFAVDVKTIKENMKIKEILKTVKINSSMRIKAPRGSKVMSNKDLSEATEHESNEEEASAQSDSTSSTVSPITTYARQAIDSDSDSEIDLSADADNHNIDYSKDIEESIQSIDDVINSLTDELNSLEAGELDNNKGHTNKVSKETINDEFDYKVRYNSHETIPRTQVQVDTLSCLPTINSVDKRTRKLSLDQTMLSRRPSLSQSEINLHLVGKSPLERKSSFFRKKMDSFLKNTSEIFKRQSLGKAGEQPGLPLRGAMSCSLQSLHDTTNLECANQYLSSQEMGTDHGSASSLTSSSTMAYSGSSRAGSHQGGRRPSASADLDSLGGSQQLSASQPLGDWSESVNSLDEAHIQELMLNSRAISMSSGLDSAKGTQRRPSSLANRVTWLASEGLTNYLRRVIQDEKSKAVQPCESRQSFSESSTPPAGKGDAAGARRLSYHRAVSGEDPAKGTNSFRRRRPLPDHHEVNPEISAILEQFNRDGVPTLKGFFYDQTSAEALEYARTADTPRVFEEHFDWKSLPPSEEARQAVIRELLYTEVDHLRNLIYIVEIFIGAAHALQEAGWMLAVDTSRLFSNMSDVLNASLSFWQSTFFPMITDAMENNTIYDTDILLAGFSEIRVTLKPYELYLNEQDKRLDYLRSLAHDTDFSLYLNWCNSQKFCRRLQLWDMLVKPMQRLAKYPIILQRIIGHTAVEPQRTSLVEMETFAKGFMTDINRSIRQKEELVKLNALIEMIDPYDLDLKDSKLELLFKAHNSLNLRAPMLGCLASHSRSVVYEGYLHFKDHIKEFDAKIFLLTDMMLVCRKTDVKGKHGMFKLVRMKYMVKKLVYQPIFSRTRHKELVGLAVVMLDDVNSSCAGFVLSDPWAQKENGSNLKMWLLKLKEARLTYELGVRLANIPSGYPSVSEPDTSTDHAIARSSVGGGGKQSSEDAQLSREAAERVAAMMHSLGASTENDYSLTSMPTDSFDTGGMSERGRSGLVGLRHCSRRSSNSGSSRNSRISSFQHSTSAASHEEAQAGPSDGNHIYTAGSSVEHIIPSRLPNEDPTSITVNVLGESESELFQPSSTSRTTSPRSQQRDRLRVNGYGYHLGSSLPDLTNDPLASTAASQLTAMTAMTALLIDRSHRTTCQSPQSPCFPRNPQTGSQHLYQLHNEHLQENKLQRSLTHYLTTEHRGKSYPPLSPARASLRRGMAFSFSSKNPPLLKMGHVNSQSQMHGEAGPSTSAAASPSTVAGPEPMVQGDHGCASSAPHSPSAGTVDAGAGDGASPSVTGTATR